MYKSRIVVLLLVCVTCIVDSADANYVLNVQPIAVYDSRYNGGTELDGSPTYDAVGTHAYTPTVNGIYVPTFDTAVNNIFSQCSIAVNFKPVIAFDSPTYLNTQSTNDLFGNDNAVGTWLTANAPVDHHYVFFTNTHTNTPAFSNNNPNSLPLGGSWGTLSSGNSLSVSAAGVAVVPNPGTVGNMRSVMSQSDDISDAASEATWANGTIPTVLAHELAHNLSLEHVTAPSLASNLMYTGAGPTGTQAVLTQSQCDDAVATGTANRTLTAVPEPSSVLFLGLIAVLGAIYKRFGAAA